jgi:hypothetical protein
MSQEKGFEDSMAILVEVRNDVKWLKEEFALHRAQHSAYNRLLFGALLAAFSAMVMAVII